MLLSILIVSTTLVFGQQNRSFRTVKFDKNGNIVNNSNYSIYHDIYNYDDGTVKFIFLSKSSLDNKFYLTYSFQGYADKSSYNKFNPQFNTYDCTGQLQIYSNDYPTEIVRIKNGERIFYQESFYKGSGKYEVSTRYGCASGDCKNGKGLLFYADGSYYEGSFKNGKFDGYGVLTLNNGKQISGSFTNDKINTQNNSSNSRITASQIKDVVEIGNGILDFSLKAVELYKQLKSIKY